MATNNKSLTTYLPDRSVEWLESYCLGYKHLQNKDGNPKLGTAVADIIARLADGELTLPEKIEPISTSPLQYGTELETLKVEVVELKSQIAKGFTHQEVRDIAAATIKDSIAFEKLVDKGEVIKIAEGIVNSAFNPLSQHLAKLPADTSAIEQLVTAKIDPVAELVDELQIYIQNQIAQVRNELKKPVGIAISR